MDLEDDSEKLGTMTLKEIFDASMKMAEFSAGRLEADRGYEWKLSLSLWALLAAAIHSFRVDSIPWWIPAVSWFLYAYWINNFWWAHRIDNIRMHSYVNVCSRFVTGVLDPTKPKEKKLKAGEIGD